MADVLWGVARREGHSDTDDPLVHQKLVQHAFPFGQDERAVCGFQPPKRASRTGLEPRPQLALAGPDNPRCPKCLGLLLPAPGPADQAMPADSPPAAHPELPVTAVDTSPEAAPRQPDWSPRAGSATNDTSEDEQDDQPASASSSRNRASARRGGRVTVPAGRRSVVTELPERARDQAIAATVDGDPQDLRVVSVSVNDDGSAQITLNKRTDTPVDVLWFIVSGPHG